MPTMQWKCSEGFYIFVWWHVDDDDDANLCQRHQTRTHTRTHTHTHAHEEYKRDFQIDFFLQSRAPSKKHR